MKQSTQILTQMEHPWPSRAVVCIGFEGQNLDLLAPFIPPGLILKSISSWEPPSKIRAEMSRAAISFVQWDGIGGKAHKLLLSLEGKGGHPLAEIYMILEKGTPKPHLPKQQASELGVKSWFELPVNNSDIKRILATFTNQSQDKLGIHDGKKPKLPINKLTPTRRDHVDLGAKESASTGKLSNSPKNLPVSQLSMLEHAFQAVNSAWQKRVLHAETPIQDGQSFAKECFILVHPEEARSLEMQKFLIASGVGEVTRTRSIDDTMSAMRKHATGLILWFDGTSRLVPSILEHMAESRQLAYVPILVILPSKDVAHDLGAQLRSFFFDAVMFYDGKVETLVQALKNLQKARQGLKTPRGLLENLRRPLKLENPPEERKSVPLEDLEALAQKIASRPGKKYWGLCELIPHYALRKLNDKALVALNQASELRPNAFNTCVLRALLTRQISQKSDGPLAFAEALLKSPDISADRLYRTALMFERWGVTDALEFLLKGWRDNPSFNQDPQLLFMTGRYFLAKGDLLKALPPLALAAAREPERTDFAEGLARLLTLLNHYDQAVSLLRLIIQSKSSSWDAKILFAHSLAQKNNFMELALLLNKLLEKNPKNIELLKIKNNLHTMRHPDTR